MLARLRFTHVFAPCLTVVPTAAFGAGFLYAAMQGLPNITQVGADLRRQGPLRVVFSF